MLPHLSDLSKLQENLFISANFAVTHTLTDTLGAHLLSGADLPPPETSVWLHMGVSSITAYSIRDGQLLPESQRPPLLLSHLIHLLADQWDSY